MPFAFTEYGAIALANVLASAQAVEMGIYVVRAFVQLRQASSLHVELSGRLAALEAKTEKMASKHEAWSRSTQANFKQIFKALNELIEPAKPVAEPVTNKRPIGFIYPKDGEEKEQPRARSLGSKAAKTLKAQKRVEEHSILTL